MSRVLRFELISLILQSKDQINPDDHHVFFHQVEFSRETEEEGVKTVKQNKRILFQRMAPYPQRKVITFNRYSDDFAFNINYGDLSFLSQDDLRLDSCLPRHANI